MININSSVLSKQCSDFVLSKINEDITLRPFLVSCTFNYYDNDPVQMPRSISRKTIIRNIERRFALYDITYRHIVSNLVPNFTRKRHLHPITLDFIDVPGTRENKPIYLSSFQNVHVHSIWLIKPPVLSGFKTAAETDFVELKNHPSISKSIQTIDAKPIALDENDIKRTASYVTKIFQYDLAESLHEDTPLFDAKPLATSELASRRSRREIVNQEAALRTQFNRRIAAANKRMTSFASRKSESQMSRIRVS